MFNSRLIANLEAERDRLIGQLADRDATIERLENRILEIVDAKLYGRNPDRLVKTLENRDNKPSGDLPAKQAPIPTDAYSVSMEKSFGDSKTRAENKRIQYERLQSERQAEQQRIEKIAADTNTEAE